MEDLIRAVTESIVAIGFEKAMLALILCAAIFHWMRSRKSEEPEPAVPSLTACKAEPCGFDPSATELMVRRVVDKASDELRRDTALTLSHFQQAMFHDLSRQVSQEVDALLHRMPR